MPPDAAPLALLDALRTRRLRLDERRIVRRHRAGVELLMREMAGEFLDVTRVEELLAVIEREPH